MWNTELGETITLAIYEEQEVVTPLDPKFVDSVLYGDGLYLYHDKVFTKKVTKAELEKIATSHLKVVHDGVISTVLKIDGEGDYLKAMIMEYSSASYYWLKFFWTAEYVEEELG